MCIQFILSLLQATKNLFSEAAQGQPLKSLGLNTDPNVEKVRKSLWTVHRQEKQTPVEPLPTNGENRGEPSQE